MGEIGNHYRVMRLAAISSRHPQAFEWATERLSQQWGPIVRSSPLFDFVETNYYAAEMGTDLKKQLLAFEVLQDPSQLPDWKHASNQWESEFQQSFEFPELRPINIDPGYLTEAKLILATTKDRDHRIYLRDGIYAEVTLFYRGKNWNFCRWTYPDYQRADNLQFLTECRVWFRQKKMTGTAD